MSDQLAAVRCRSVTKSFPMGDGAVEILHGIDLEGPTGELTMLFGPSGCGKPTLISTIAGILSRTSGEVETCGKPLTRMSDAEKVAFRRSNIGFIFQQYNLLPALTATENAAIPLVAAGMPIARAAAPAAAILDRIGMGAHLGKLPNQPSGVPHQCAGGQPPRVAIARALIPAPRLSVCDEPTAALDADSGQTVLKILKDAALAPDRAVIIVTHDPRIYRFADRIAAMEDGRIHAVRTAPFAHLSEAA